MTIGGRNVLVVEDDPLIAHDIADELQSAGYTVLGPALRLEAAVALAKARDVDAAILDVFLDGAYVWSLAGMLAARAVPFVFLTGFSGFLEFPASFASVRRLDKPLRHGTLRRELDRLLPRSGERLLARI